MDRKSLTNRTVPEMVGFGWRSVVVGGGDGSGVEPSLENLSKIHYIMVLKAWFHRSPMASWIVRTMGAKK